MYIFSKWTANYIYKCPGFIEKNEWPPNSLVQNPLDHKVWGAMLGRCQKFTPKPSNIAELKTALLSIWNDLPQEFIDKAILSFQKRLDFRELLQLVDVLNTTVSLNTERTADIHHWNVWIVDGKLCKIWFIITKNSESDCVFTWKWTLKFKLLYLLNHMSYFNKICRICGLNPPL